MFLLYLDGSGTTAVSDPNSKVFVLLGVAVHEGTWFAIDKRVAALRQRYELPGLAIELHAKDICVSIAEQDEVADFEQLPRPERRRQVQALRARKLASKQDAARRSAQKRYRGTDAVVHLTRRERSTLYEEALDIVGSHEGIHLFAEAVDKQHLLRATGRHNAAGHAFEQVISRFDRMLQAFARSAQRQVNNGMAVADVDPDSDLMRELTTLFRDSGHRWGTLEHVIETPFFVDSKAVPGVQLADICAYAVRRYVEKEQRAGSAEEQQFLRIFDKFDRSGDALHGLRHYCQAGTCSCQICLARGH